MTLIDDIRARFSRNEFEFSKHATDQSLLRDISVQELREAAGTGEVIEDYPNGSDSRFDIVWLYFTAEIAKNAEKKHKIFSALSAGSAVNT